jgi:anti-sigma factor RsiW
MTQGERPVDDDIELLLPWHAAGTLDPRDAERVERAIAENAEIARRYRLALEERAGTVHVNEALPVAAAGAMQRLLSRIDAEAEHRARPFVRSRGVDWVARRLSQLGPRTLVWSALAAGFLILVQAGLLGAIYVSGPGPARYETASVPQAEIGIGFVPQATASEITRFAETYHLSIVEGPLAGDLFKMRVIGAPMTTDELRGLARRIQQESSIARVAAVAE